MSKPLLQRNTNILLIWLPIVLLVSSGIFYVMLRKHAHHAEEKYLLLKQQNVWDRFTATSGALEKHIAGEFDISEGDALTTGMLNVPRDTAIFYPAEGKDLPFKVLTNRYQWNDRSYLVSTYISSTETTHLIIKVFASEAVILLVLLVAIVVLSRKSSGRLWQPFFSSISSAEKFDIVRNSHFQLPEEIGRAHV